MGDKRKNAKKKDTKMVSQIIAAVGVAVIAIAAVIVVCILNLKQKHTIDSPSYFTEYQETKYTETAAVQSKPEPSTVQEESSSVGESESEITKSKNINDYKFHAGF